MAPLQRAFVTPTCRIAAASLQRVQRVQRVGRELGWVQRPDDSHIGTHVSYETHGSHSHGPSADPAEPAESADTVITIERLSKRFGAFLALDRIDLTIGTGELFFLLGPSGCGK